MRNDFLLASQSLEVIYQILLVPLILPRTAIGPDNTNRLIKPNHLINDHPFHKLLFRFSLFLFFLASPSLLERYYGNLGIIIQCLLLLRASLRISELIDPKVSDTLPLSLKLLIPPCNAVDPVGLRE